MPSKSGSPLITRSKNPLNLEWRFSRLEDELTPTSEFFVRNHFPIPKINNNQSHLQIEGAVRQTLTLSLKRLIGLPAVTQSAVIECSGNGRRLLESKSDGVQWGLGAVGCASWTGVPLAAVLDLAGIHADTVEIVAEGADHGVPEKPSRPKNEIFYSHSIPISVAKRADVLLAYEMNGAPLSTKHGAPLRLIVPGWYGMASVKWLTRLIAVTEPFHGYFQTAEYSYWTASDRTPPERRAVTEMSVKSQIARPAPRERVRLGSTYRIFGAAWTSDARIETVDVSTDQGKTWRRATLGYQPSDHAWQFWEFAWKPKSAGKFTLLSRATDSRGRTQPKQHDDNHQSYMIHHNLPVAIEVV